MTIRLGSYSWIFDNISHNDMVAMVGVLIFVFGVIATMIGMCTAYAKYDRRILIISIILLLIMLMLYAVLEYV